jgi:hypothetical protein
MLHEKVTNLINEETKNLNIPAQSRKTGSILLAKGEMDVTLYGDKMKVKMVIKLNSKGYWIEIGGLAKMVKTIDQVNKVLDIETRQKELTAERDKLIDRLIKSGLKKIDLSNWSYGDYNYGDYVEPYTAFKISGDKIIQIIKYDKWKPLDEKIIIFHCSSSSNWKSLRCHPKYFDRTFKEFLSEKKKT